MTASRPSKFTQQPNKWYCWWWRNPIHHHGLDVISPVNNGRSTTRSQLVNAGFLLTSTVACHPIATSISTTYTTTRHYHYCWMEEIHRNHLTRMKPCKPRDISYISTGECRIPEPCHACTVMLDPIHWPPEPFRRRKRWHRKNGVVEMLKANPSPFFLKKLTKFNKSWNSFNYIIWFFVF